MVEDGIVVWARRTYTAEFGAWICNLFEAHAGAPLPEPRDPPSLSPLATDLELFHEHCLDGHGVLKGDPWNDVAWTRERGLRYPEAGLPAALCYLQKSRRLADALPGNWLILADIATWLRSILEFSG